MAVLGRIRFQTLEASLCILQNTGTFIQGNIRVGGKDAFVPGTILIHGNIAVIRWHIAETDVAPVDIFLFHNRCSNLTEFYDLVTV